MPKRGLFRRGEIEPGTGKQALSKAEVFLGKVGKRARKTQERQEERGVFAAQARRRGKRAAFDAAGKAQASAALGLRPFRIERQRISRPEDLGLKDLRVLGKNRF